jgi:hypothetical protein
MANLTAQLTLDMSGAQTQFTAVKNAVSALPPLVQAVQATIPSITLTGTAGAPASGTVTFVVDNAQTDAAVANLLTQATTLRDAVVALQGQLDAMAPVVTSVT